MKMIGTVPAKSKTWTVSLFEDVEGEVNFRGNNRALQRIFYFLSWGRWILKTTYYVHSCVYDVINAYIYIQSRHSPVAKLVYIQQLSREWSQGLCKTTRWKLRLGISCIVRVLWAKEIFHGMQQSICMKFVTKYKSCQESCLQWAIFSLTPHHARCSLTVLYSIGWCRERIGKVLRSQREECSLSQQGE